MKNQSNIFAPKIGYLFILPVFLSLVSLILYPVLYGIYISFFNTNLLNKWTYKGLYYYREILASVDFYNTLIVTIKFTFFTVLGHFILGMLFAVILNSKSLPYKILFRSILILPWFFPEVVTAILWRWLLNPTYGLINYMLINLHIIAQPLEWLSSPNLALGSVIFTAVWRGYPLILILFLSGLQTIPNELYESAEIDGANKGQKFYHITLSSLRHIITVAMTLDIIWWFKHFTIIWVLTQGGPGKISNVIAIDVYKFAFENFKYGKASAMGVVLFLMVLVVSLISRKFGANNEKS